MKGAKELAESNAAFIQRVRAAHAKLSSDKYELEHDDIDACPLWYDGCNCVKAILSWLPGLTDRLQHADSRLAAIDSALPGEVGEIRKRVNEALPPGGLTFREETQRKDLATLLAIVQRQAGEIAALKQEHFAATLAIEQTLHETEQRSDAARAEVERLKVRDAQTVADGLAVLNKLTDARCALQKMREALSQEESEHLAALADLDEARAKAAALAHENAVLINEVGNLDATAREQRQRAEVLVRGIAAYRTGSFTLAQVWENEEGKAVKR